jgi:hypothetical protein
VEKSVRASPRLRMHAPPSVSSRTETLMCATSEGH